MRIKSLALLAATLFNGLGARVCFGQSDNVTTIIIEDTGGQITTTPPTASIPSSSTAQTFKWVSRDPKAQFRIEFALANPCNPRNSRLNRTPATCHVLPSHDGIYMYRIVPKGRTGASTGPIMLAQVGSCEACFPPTGARPVGIACDRNKTAQAVPTDLTVAPRSAFSWIALGPGSLQWTVTFGGPSPCKGNTFDAKNPVCEVTGPAAQYAYSIKLDGCASPGRGEITVK